ncbi:MAG: hypothetical protein ACLSU6_16235 [Thomasclavelia ramosa]
MDEFLSEIYIEVFKQWILMQSNKNLAISLSDDYKTIAIKNKYSTSQVNFYNMNIVEFSVENLIKKKLNFISISKLKISNMRFNYLMKC